MVLLLTPKKIAVCLRVDHPMGSEVTNKDKTTYNSRACCPNDTCDDYTFEL